MASALAEAKDAGYELPQPITKESLQWLESRVRAKSNKPPFYNPDAWTTSRAFMLYALARHGRVLRADIDELAAALPSTQTYANAEAASHLLRAVELANDPALDRHRASLLDLLERQVRVEQRMAYLDVPEDPEYGWIYPSSVRATAHGVIALSESSDDPDRLQLIQRMVRYLIDTRSGGWWQSTQDNAVVVDALKTFYNTFEEQEPDFTAEVRMAGERILSEAFRGRSLGAVSREVSLEKFASLETVPVDITASGAGRLYYDLLVETYSTEPQAALSSGLRVQRRIQRIDDGGQPVGQPFVTGGRDLALQGGEMVLVTITLTSPSDRNFVVVDDALPAGLEAVNTSFVTADRVATQSAGTNRWWGSFNHTEIRDDRVLLFADYLTRGEHRYSYVARATTPGTFVHPPAQAELMYRPEVRGRNATGRLIVTVEGEETAGREALATRGRRKQTIDNIFNSFIADGIANTISHRRYARAYCVAFQHSGDPRPDSVGIVTMCITLDTDAVINDPGRIAGHVQEALIVYDHRHAEVNTLRNSVHTAVNECDVGCCHDL